MTDIVERLRDADHVRLVAGAHWGTLCTEAADEIVRLQMAFIDEQNKAMKLRAEIAKLRAALLLHHAGIIDVEPCPRCGWEHALGEQP